MAAAKYDFTIEQGATFVRGLTVRDSNSQPINLTGWALRGMMRESQSAGTPAAVFTCTLLDQTTDTGKATFGLSATDTANIKAPAFDKPAFKNATFIYDLEAERPGGEVLKLLQGTVTFVPEITK